MERISRTGVSLADMLAQQIAAFPCSGEINFQVTDAQLVVERIVRHYRVMQPVFDYTDGVSADFGEWRFNLRSSNTEPLLRLNVEARRNPVLVDQKLAEIRKLIG